MVVTRPWRSTNEIAGAFSGRARRELDLRHDRFQRRRTLRRDSARSVRYPRRCRRQRRRSENVERLRDILKTNWRKKNLTLQLNEVASDKAALTAPSRTFVRLLNATPNGVIRNSDVAKGVVETSLNVGVVTMSDARCRNSLPDSLSNRQR